MHSILLHLFEQCLNKDYTEGPHGASFAYDRIGDALFLWFEHSNGTRDWMHNLLFGAVPYRDMDPEWLCHAGFLRVFRDLRPLLQPLYRDPTLRRVCTVGYSHGAALSLLAHEAIWFERPDLRATLCSYAFGCPRVLCGCPPEAVTSRWEHFYRVVNGDDLVAHLPPRALGFCHVGTPVPIGTPGKDSPVDAHRPEHYLAALQELF